MAGDPSIFISSGGIRLVGSLLKTPQDTTSYALTTWENNLYSLGSPWGDDQIGEKFAERYVPSQQNTAQALRDVVAGIQGLIDDFNLMASNYDVTEQANSQ